MAKIWRLRDRSCGQGGACDLSPVTVAETHESFPYRSARAKMALKIAVDRAHQPHFLQDH